MLLAEPLGSAEPWLKNTALDSFRRCLKAELFSRAYGVSINT